MSKTAQKVRQKKMNVGSGAPRSDLLTRWTVPMLVAVLTFAAFWPVLDNRFLNWDDEAILINNPAYRGLGWKHLKWMFTTFHHSLYRPLTWVTWGGDYLVWEMNPLGYHLTSLIFHCANAVIFFFIACRLFRLSLPNVSKTEWPARVAAGVAAALFSIHPLRVEPVAWASGRENVLSGLFFLLTILFYLKAVESSKSRSHYGVWMISALAVFGMSLLSKAAGMTLPFALLILDIYPLRRLPPNVVSWLQRSSLFVWYEKIPFIFLGASAGAVGWFAKHQEGGMFGWDQYGLTPRLSQSVYGLVFYLWKTLLPLNLSPLYELPEDILKTPSTIIACAIILAAITTALILIRNRYPAGLASWLFYIVIVSPVLGISQSGPQIAADRYTYMACLGWPILVGGGFYKYWDSWTRAAMKKNVITLAAAILMLTCALGTLSRRQTRVWYDSETLWRHALSITPSTIGSYYLGVTLDRQGRAAEAIQQYRNALEIRPNYFDAQYALGGVLFRAGELSQATQHYRLALKLNPGHADLHVDLANTLALQGRMDEAMQHYRQALLIDPTSGNAYFNMGNSFARTEQFAKALESYRLALKISPTHSYAHFNLANTLVTRGDLNGAVEHYLQAVKYRPEFPEAYHNLGRVFAAQGQPGKAIEQFRHAVTLRQDFAEAHASLSQALMEQGNRDEAMRHYEEAIRLSKLSRISRP